MIDPKDILTHFYGTEEKKRKEPEGSVLFFGTKELETNLENMSKYSEPIVFLGKYFSGVHMPSNKPTELNALEKAKSLLNLLGDSEKSNIFKYHQLELKFEKVSSTLWWYGKANYFKLPIQRSAKWICVPNKESSDISSNNFDA